MNAKNSLAGTCFQCGGYVGVGKGQLLKNQSNWRRPLVAGGHRFVVRCGPCSATKAPNPEVPAAAPPLPSSRPNEANMSPAALNLYRQSLRKSLLALLSDEDMPADKVRPGQAWLEAKARPLEVLYQFKDRLIQLRNEGRDHRLNGRSQAAA